MTDPPIQPRGRPRDAGIDDGVLDAALRELAAKGFSGFSIAAVAEAAGTTRPAIYRRWDGKVALVVDAVARLAETEPPSRTGDPFPDLVTELEDFRHCISEAGSLPLAGLMLTDGIDTPIRDVYLERIVGPRRNRLRGILRAAQDAGVLAADADLDMVGTFFTGSWYSLHIANRPVPRDWAHRVAALVWRACGGTPPD